jgi:hypothetical protein
MVMRRDIYVNISTIYQQRFKFNPFKTDDIDYPPKASRARHKIKDLGVNAEGCTESIRKPAFRIEPRNPAEQPALSRFFVAESPPRRRSSLAPAASA